MLLPTIIVSAAEKIGAAAIGFVTEQALYHVDEIAAGVEVIGCVAESSCGIIHIGSFFDNHFRAVGGEFVVALGTFFGEFHFDALSVTQERVEVFAEHFRLVREFKVFAVERLACGVGGDSPDVAESQ